MKEKLTHLQWTLFGLFVLFCGVLNRPQEKNDHFLPTSKNSTSLNVSIQKCKCNTGQMWLNKACSDNDTFIPMLEFATWTETKHNSKLMDVSAISMMKCGEGQLRVPLKGGSFYIIKGGDLFHLFTGLIYSKGEYCVEHVLGRLGNARLDAFVCVQRPNISRCCPEQHVYDKSSSQCIFSSGAPFSPLISKEPAILQWHYVNGAHTGFPLCYPSEIQYRLSLEGKEAALLYRSNGIFLHWKTAPFERPLIVGQQDYCVAVEKTSTHRYSHLAYYCDRPYNEHISLKDETRGQYKTGNNKIEDSYLFSYIILADNKK